MGGMPRPLPQLDPVPTATDCCSPLAHSPLTADEAAAARRPPQVPGRPARLRLVSILLASPDQEACTCDLTDALGLSQPTVSHHLKKLATAGIVTAHRRGVWTYYRVVPDALHALADVLVTPVAP